MSDVTPTELESPSRRPLSSRILRGAFALFAVLVVILLVNVRRDVPLAELKPKYADGASRFTKIDDVDVHYRDEGQGPPLVLIHGTSSSLHTWDGWVARMSARHRIVRLDLPGYGLTGPAPDKDYSAARYARVVVGLLDHLGIPRADIAGNSLGGRVAMTIALENASRVNRLVLVDAAGLSGQRLPPIFRLARMPVLSGLLRWVTPRAIVRANVEDVYGDRSRVTDSVVDRYYDLMRREGNRQATIDRFVNLADPDLDDRLRDIHVPVLIEWGERDQWIPVAFAHRLEDGIKGAKLVVYPDAGHVPMEELPELTAEDAERFLGVGGDRKRGD